MPFSKKLKRFEEEIKEQSDPSVKPKPLGKKDSHLYHCHLHYCILFSVKKFAFLNENEVQQMKEEEAKKIKAYGSQEKLLEKLANDFNQDRNGLA